MLIATNIQLKLFQLSKKIYKFVVFQLLKLYGCFFSGYSQGGYGGGPMRTAGAGGAGGYRTAPYGTGAAGGFQVITTARYPV